VVTTAPEFEWTAVNEGVALIVGKRAARSWATR
jgi:hypothetical protein